MKLCIPLSLLVLSTTSGFAVAQPITASYDEPTLDRWMYPFNATPGTRSAATVFGAALFEGFDDRDGQFIVGFDTFIDVPAGEPLGSYQITSLTVRATLSAGAVDYDNTYDNWQTYLTPGMGGYVEDNDAGRPLELFGLGYRGGFDVSTFEENSLFGGAPVVQPAQGNRHAFAATFDATGENAVDASNSIKDGFDAVPMGIGGVNGLTPGDEVPLDSEFVFEIDLGDPAHVGYLQRGLQAGRLNFSITTMIPGVGADPVWPIMYTKENALAQILELTPKLDLQVTMGNPADLNGDGVVDSGDLALFINLFLAGDLAADLTGDGVVDSGDLALFIQLFLAASGG